MPKDDFNDTLNAVTWGYRACERGLSIQQAEAEFTKLFCSFQREKEKADGLQTEDDQAHRR